MPSTNAVAFKAALTAVLTDALQPIRVDYAYNGKLVEREYVYLGKATGPHEPMVFRNGQRLIRKEDLTVDLYVEVLDRAGTPQDTDARAVEIGLTIEELIAADPRFGGRVPGLLLLTVGHTNLTSFFMEDGASASQLLYQLNVQSQLN